MVVERKWKLKPTRKLVVAGRHPSDPLRQVVERVQRGRMILDVAQADLDASESACGYFHPTTWHFRNAWYETLRAWDRLRADVGGGTLEAALEEPPMTVLALGPGASDYRPDPDGRWPLPHPTAPVLLIPIGGQTYRAFHVGGTDLAPRLWRLTRLHPPLEDGPYYACRLRNQTTRCDCAEWTYQIADLENPPHALCKHLAALSALGWL